MSFDLASPVAHEWHYFDDVRRAHQQTREGGGWKKEAVDVTHDEEPLIPARTYRYYDHGIGAINRWPIGVVDYYRCWPVAPPQTELVESIKAKALALREQGYSEVLSYANGIEMPLVVYTDGTRGLLAEGNHRLQAAKEIGIKQLRVLVVPDHLILPRGMSEVHLRPAERYLRDAVHDLEYRHTNHELKRFQVDPGSTMHVYCSCGAQWMRDDR